MQVLYHTFSLARYNLCTGPKPFTRSSRSASIAKLLRLEIRIAVKSSRLAFGSRLALRTAPSRALGATYLLDDVAALASVKRNN